MEKCGWLCIDKPHGVSSTKIVSIVRSLLKMKKVGHGGTLDPLASGVLPVAIGEATKTVPFVQDCMKKYEFGIQFGKETDSYDEEGCVVAENDFMPEESKILNELGGFLGNIKQTPPIFSAIRISGRRAYDMARAGEEVSLKKRDIFIKSLEITDYNSKKMQAKFEVECGKGTYIRSLGHDLAKKCGGIGYIFDLRRTKVGIFGEKNLISLEILEKIVHNGDLDDVLLSVDSVLDGIPAILFSEEEAKKLLNGVKLEIESSRLSEQNSEVYLAKNSDNLLAIGKVIDQRFIPVRIFNFNKEYYDVDY